MKINMSKRLTMLFFGVILAVCPLITKAINICNRSGLDMNIEVDIRVNSSTQEFLKNNTCVDLGGVATRMISWKRSGGKQFHKTNVHQYTNIIIYKRGLFIKRKPLGQLEYGKTKYKGKELIEKSYDEAGFKKELKKLYPFADIDKMMNL